MKIIAFVAALAVIAPLSITPVLARDLDGVTIPDRITLPDEKRPLVLNGAGYEKKLLVRIYIGALYLTSPIHSADRILNASTPKAMYLHYLREMSASKQAAAWRDGLAANLSTFEIQGLRKRIGQFTALLHDAKPGDVIRIDLLERGQTRIWHNDKLRGTVEGSDLQIAILKVWLGPKPVDKELKQAVLGGKK